MDTNKTRAFCSIRVYSCPFVARFLFLEVVHVYRMRDGASHTIS